MKIDYYVERFYLGQLEINDDGNFCIEANNDKMLFWYLFVRTSLGKTQIVTYGPIIPDIELFPNNVSCSFMRIDYDKSKINLLTTKFLNDVKKQITQAKILDINDGLSKCKSIIDYMKNFDENLRY